nr:hypothetical protein [Campylobacter showae]
MIERAGAGVWGSNFAIKFGWFLFIWRRLKFDAMKFDATKYGANGFEVKF